jgi:hypothetical protein
MTTTGASAEPRWLDLDCPVRRRVARAVRKGRVVGDPWDAALAVGYCAATLDWLSQRRRLLPFQLLIALVLVADLMVTWTVPVSPLLGAVVGLGLVRVRTPALRRRVTAALEANADVAAESDLTPVGVRLPGHAWLSPGHRRRRLVVVLSAALGSSCMCSSPRAS